MDGISLTDRYDAGGRTQAIVGACVGGHGVQGCKPPVPQLLPMIARTTPHQVDPKSLRSP